jgi:hypothetical protein
MKKDHSTRRKRKAPKAMVRLPDLGHAKGAVLNSLTFPDTQRCYWHAIGEFIDWYRSEPASPSTGPSCCGGGSPSPRA